MISSVSLLIEGLVYLIAIAYVCRKKSGIRLERIIENKEIDKYN